MLLKGRGSLALRLADRISRPLGGFCSAYPPISNKSWMRIILERALPSSNLESWSLNFLTSTQWVKLLVQETRPEERSYFFFSRTYWNSSLFPRGTAPLSSILFNSKKYIFREIYQKMKRKWDVIYKEVINCSTVHSGEDLLFFKFKKHPLVGFMNVPGKALDYPQTRVGRVLKQKSVNFIFFSENSSL